MPHAQCPILNPLEPIKDNLVIFQCETLEIKATLHYHANICN
ncbi:MULTISPECIES: hypothetical protein [unclassified Calothrix]|nr:MULTISPECIES: hypothetical protein [unclassified Calothrix]